MTRLELGPGALVLPREEKQARAKEPSRQTRAGSVGPQTTGREIVLIVVAQLAQEKPKEGKPPRGNMEKVCKSNGKGKGKGKTWKGSGVNQVEEGTEEEYYEECSAEEWAEYTQEAVQELAED